MSLKYPEAALAMKKRAITYNTELWLAKKYEEQGKVLIVAPDDIGDMKTLTRDKEAIDLLYHKGYADAEAIKSFVGVEEVRRKKKWIFWK